VYDEMPTLRSDGQEGEAPGSIHVRILWLEIAILHRCRTLRAGRKREK